MDREYEAFVQRYIPSKDMRAAIMETGHRFTDWERATIIWNSDDSLTDRHEGIQNIADETTDEDLRRQILERIEYDTYVLTLFAEHAQGFIYALNALDCEPEDRIVGYFVSQGMALEEGRKLGVDFAIEKHQIQTEDIVRIKPRSISAPIIEPDESKQIEEMDCYGAVARVEYDPQGRIVSYWSGETDKERAIKVESLSNKRFENKYVLFPEIFEPGEWVRVLPQCFAKREYYGWTDCYALSREEMNKKAAMGNIAIDYSDATYPVDIWDEEELCWWTLHVQPIHMERAAEERCNSFDEDHQVIIGHDSGKAVWIRVVEVDASQRILSENVREIGMEISVQGDFFDRVLKPLFVEAFDPELPENKKRYTYAFGEEGRCLRGYEENILEYNFFNYEQMEMIVARIENSVNDGVWRLYAEERRQGRCDGKDVEQMVTFARHLKHIMEEMPDQRLVAVLS